MLTRTMGTIGGQLWLTVGRKQAIARLDLYSGGTPPTEVVTYKAIRVGKDFLRDKRGNVVLGERVG